MLVKLYNSLLYQNKIAFGKNDRLQYDVMYW